MLFRIAYLANRFNFEEDRLFKREISSKDDEKYIFCKKFFSLRFYTNNDIFSNFYVKSDILISLEDQRRNKIEKLGKIYQIISIPNNIGLVQFI